MVGNGLECQPESTRAGGIRTRPAVGTGHHSEQKRHLLPGPDEERRAKPQVGSPDRGHLRCHRRPIKTDEEAHGGHEQNAPLTRLCGHYRSKHQPCCKPPDGQTHQQGQKNGHYQLGAMRI